MVQRREIEVGNFVGDALAALGIGIWSWQGTPAKVTCCSVAAHLFGVPSPDAWNGLPLERYAVGVHPDDRAYFSRLVSQAMHTGGSFVAEYRTVNKFGATRLVLDRGEFDLGLNGRAVAARGVVVDMTDRPKGLEIKNSLGDAPNFSNLSPLHQAVEHALALHRLIDVLPEGWRHPTDIMIKTILEMLGKEVAASLERDGFHPSHTQRSMH